MSDDHDESQSGSERTAEIAEGLEQATETLGQQVHQILTRDQDSSGGSDPEDHTAEDVEHAFDAVSQSAGAVQQAANVAHDVNQATDHFEEGDNWGGSADYIDAGSASAGHIADGLGSLGAMTGDRGLRDAAAVMRGVQAVSRFAGTVVRQIGDAVEHGLEGSRHVEYELHVDGSSEEWHVHSVEITEALSEPYEAVIHAHCASRDVDIQNDLLGRDAELIIDRRHSHTRRICGIVSRVAEIGSRRHQTEVEIHLAPAFALLAHGRDSRVYQEKTAVEIIEDVLRLAFSPYRREVDISGLIGTYVVREMCVQYRESYRDFVSRLLEEEGIGYYFEFDGDGPEKLVLFDGNEQLATVATMDGNPVPFHSGAQLIHISEPIVSFESTHRLTPTSVTVRDLDWTDSQYRAEAERDDQDLRGRTRSVYDHGHGRSVTLYDFSPGARYGGNDAAFQAQIRQELLVRDQDRFTGVSMVIGVQPGVTFEMTDHPVPGLDGQYVIVKVRHVSAAPPHGAAEHHASGDEYHNVFECIPLDTSYRPERNARKPAIYSVQTAVVTGPVPGEPYTDEYGRVRVLFHWDREGADPTTAWIRVAQTWAGHDGSGNHTFLFIPRVGTEVVVTFLDGDPDRPLVTGAVYNAQNRPPLSLPDEATRSVIRTETIGGAASTSSRSRTSRATRRFTSAPSATCASACSTTTRPTWATTTGTRSTTTTQSS